MAKSYGAKLIWPVASHHPAVQTRRCLYGANAPRSAEGWSTTPGEPWTTHSVECGDPATVVYAMWLDDNDFGAAFVRCRGFGDPTGQSRLRNPGPGSPVVYIDVTALLGFDTFEPEMNSYVASPS